MTSKKQDPRSRRDQSSRTKQNGAGGNRGKTRPDVPSTQANKAATGKQVRKQGVRGRG